MVRLASGQTNRVGSRDQRGGTIRRTRSSKRTLGRRSPLLSPASGPMLGCALALVLALAWQPAALTGDHRTTNQGPSGPGTVPRLASGALFHQSIPDLNSPGGGWMQWDNSTDPPPRAWAGSTDDPAEGGLLLFGGMNSSSTGFNDTWLFHDGAWTELCSGSSAPPSCGGGPFPRLRPAMVYDAADNEVVLFGGGYLFSFNDTWVFAGGHWTNVTTPVGPATGGGQMAYDASDKYVVWFGADNSTWTFSNQSWHQLHPTVSPPSRYGAAFFYDDSEHAVILWGGPFGNDTWAFHGGDWTQLHPVASPPPGDPAGYGYDSAVGYGLVFAPYGPPFGYGSTFLFQNGNWTNETAQLGPVPPDLTWPVLAFDSADGYFVLFEMTGAGSNQSETWLLTDSLSASFASTATTADVGQNLTLTAAAVGGIRPYDFTLSGLPPGCGPALNASVASITVNCHLSGQGVFGPVVNATDSLNDSTSTALGTLTVNPMLSVSLSASPNPATAGVPVLLQASVTGGTPSTTGLWSISDGTMANGTQLLHSFPVGGSYGASFVTTDGAGAALNAGLVIRVNPIPTATASASTNTTDVGVPVTFSVSSSGGTSPIAVGWGFGDGTSSNLTIVAHQYLSPSTYFPRVWVNDSLGASASQGLEVVVNPDPVASVYPSTASPRLGEPLTVRAVLEGGTAPFDYVWWADGVAQTATGPSVNVTFLVPGNHTVGLTITDGAGVQVTASTTLGVASATGNGSAPSSPTSPGTSLLVTVLAASIAAGVALVSLAVVLRSRAKRRGG